MSTELKPCPFCGGDKISLFTIRDGMEYACTTCGAEVRAYHPNAEQKAKTKWNTRANPWLPIEQAPKNGTSFWGFEDGNAIHMFWHEGFNEFVSSFRRMTMAEGLTIDGKTFKDHSPEIHKPTHFMPVIEPLNP